MAFIKCSYFSKAMMANIDINVMLPTPEKKDAFHAEGFSYYPEDYRCRVLYLLHGGYGDYTDWSRMSPLEYYIKKRNVAVICPCGGNSYYQDMYYGDAYFTFLTEELPEFVGNMFPVLSGQREDTFIAGLSMGGYGAVRAAFSHPERYAAAASLSGVLDLQARIQSDLDKGIKGLRFGDIFQNPARIGEDADLLQLAVKAAGRDLPRLFLTTGTKDFVYEYNQSARKAFDQAGIDYTYEEHPGDHNWDYWNLHILRVLEWFGLKKA
ncbi:alpha/beta hydrolase family protein [Anaerolentibacter hominis]|uniref:alpha/beta hydrolase n=1 Tax=Anaerolentibacter hominis TaxID=3079009 RepID=UPI0031B86813